MANASDAPSLPPQVSAPAFELDEAPLRPRESGTVVAVPVLAAVGDDDDLSLGPGAAALEELLGVDLLSLLDHHGATGKAGEIVAQPVLHHAQFHSVACVGVGSGTSAELRRAGAALARLAKDRELVATTLSSLADDEGLAALVEGLTLGSFEFHWRSGGPKAQPVRRVVLAAPADRQPVLDRAVALATASWRARAMATTPANLKTPAWLAGQAAEIAASAGLAIKVWDDQALAAGGFGGLCGVGGAAAAGPRLIRLDYAPKKKARGHLVLVGKGITFDSGGLSIKPGELMVNMKRDMTGGGVVMATMAALAEVGCPVKVTGLIAAAENAISGSALRPGDVIRHYGGRTTEVTNTDAEGRLVLADALAYGAELDPDVIVDVATLTGAVKVALGVRTAGLFATNDTLADRLVDAGDVVGEPYWRLPLVDDYDERLSSKVADADNSPTGASAGSIMAALFLRHFTGGLPWAHLDIASVGDAAEDDGIYTAGPTGFGARTLLHWLGQDDPLEGLR